MLVIFSNSTAMIHQGPKSAAAAVRSQCEAGIPFTKLSTPPINWIAVNAATSVIGTSTSACMKSPATTAQEPPAAATKTTTTPHTRIVTRRSRPKTGVQKIARP